MEFVLVGLTLLAVIRYWRVDLIESRRRLRLWFCALNGIYILVLLFLREAARRLASPADQSMPALSIAMDCGFRSLSSFNKTFRQEYGDTPTAFRRQHLG